MKAEIKNSLAVALLAACGLPAALPLSAQAQTGNEEYQAGLDAASDYRYAQALSNFQTATARGDKDAQRNSGLMLLYGEHLYGAEVRADRTQALKWLTLAAGQGDEVSALMLRRLAARR